MSNELIVSAVAKSASYNIILQVLMRIVSFISNAFILRYITKDVLGVINVRLMLLYSTTHCISREAFRRSCLCNFDRGRHQKIISFLWLTVPLCLFCSIILRIVWLYVLEEPDVEKVPDYSSGVNTILICTVVEMLAEPLYVLGQSFHFIKLKVIIEGLSLTVKSVCMVALLPHWPQNGVYIFCFSQIVASIFYTSSYYVYFGRYIKLRKNDKKENKENCIFPIISLAEIFPKWSTKEHFVDWEIVVLTWSFFKQTILKQILTEGERYMMTLFNVLTFSEQEGNYFFILPWFNMKIARIVILLYFIKKINVLHLQHMKLIWKSMFLFGIYDVVSNLGSMAARFIFLPIEESGYLLFSHLLNRDQPLSKQTNADLCSSVLENLLKLMILLGLTILTFGFSYSQLLLLLYGGSSLSSGIALILLRWHCLYIVLLAVNGVTECFVFAAMNHKDIDRYNQKMVVLSAAFLFLSYYLTGIFSSVGFILANCFNMGARILHSIYFIELYFKDSNISPLKGLLPHPTVLILYGVSFFLTSLSEVYFCCSQGYQFWLLHFLIGTCCFLLVFGVTFCKEKQLMLFIKRHWIKKNFMPKNKQS